MKRWIRVLIVKINAIRRPDLGRHPGDAGRTPVLQTTVAGRWCNRPTGLGCAQGSSLHRLLTRTGNDYGRDAAELAEQLELNRLAGSARWGPGWITVDATRPVEEVADDIVRLTLGPV
jgi:hypothetical protein